MSKYKDSQPTEKDIHRAMRSHRMPKEIERIIPFSEAVTVLVGAVVLMALIVLLTNWLLSTVQSQMSGSLHSQQGIQQVEDRAEPHELAAPALIQRKTHDQLG